MEKGIKTHCRVVVAGGVGIERSPSQGRVVEAGCEAEEGPLSLCRVPARKITLRVSDYRLRCGEKAEAGEQECDKRGCCGSCFHFFFSRL